jgi:hypothetical protein
MMAPGTLAECPFIHIIRVMRVSHLVSIQRYTAVGHFIHLTFGRDANKLSGI